MSSPQENVYCFISGKNWKLSLAELASYFDARGWKFEVSEFSRSFFTLKTQTPLDPAIVDDLGGTLKIAIGPTVAVHNSLSYRISCPAKILRTLRA
ncbi:MAG: hypothetical protein ACBZ72_13245 [Candidatus Bathyarchaeia archaeon]|jgi:hypothetical protein